MAVKINQLEIENIKRVKAVKMEPAQNGLTVIGGNNAQGKTSVLDAITWALGGERYRPSKPEREGSTIPPYLKVVLSNGLVVERKGKNSSLTVTDPSGQKGGQKLLDEFIETLALDLPKFMTSSAKDKANTLLQIIGVGPQLAVLDAQERQQYNDRLAIGRIADQKTKFAKEQQYFPDAPAELVSPSELIRQQQEILARNGENQRKRERLHQLEQEYQSVSNQMQSLLARMNELEADLKVARTDALDLMDESTAELEESIRNVDEINRKVRINMDKDKAEEDAREYVRQYDALTVALQETRKKREALLDDAELPLPGLSVEDGELTYNGQCWDNMSGAEQLIVATAIVRKLKPECGFVLLDKLEQMDVNTMNRFGEWLEQEGLQAIATRVSTGEECQIVIEDGYAVTPETAPAKTWKEGTF